MKRLLFRCAAIVAALMTTSLAYGTGQAATCSSASMGDLSSFVIGDDSGSNSGCQMGSTPKDRISTHLRVNRDGLFGQDTWVNLRRLDRFGSDKGSQATSLEFTFIPTTRNAGLAGTFSVSDTIFDAFDSYMIVVAAKAKNADPSVYLSYLFDADDGVTGTINSPFFHTQNGKTRRALVFSLYALPQSGPAPIPAPNPVPVPSAALLLIAGLGGLAVVSRVSGSRSSA